MPAPTLDAARLARRLTRRPRAFALFDVREAGEAEAGHIPGATFLPRRLIEFRLDELVSAPATPIVVYDDGGGRAGLAAATMAGMGYRDVAVLDGGVPAWKASGRRVESGVNVPSKRFGEHLLEEDGVPSITVDELHRRRRARLGFEQWDVRTPAEFTRATIAGSRNVPGVEIVREVARLKAAGIPVAVHCAGRTRSILAARTLALLGVPDVVAVENGTMGWRLSGRSLVPGGGLAAEEARCVAVAHAEADRLAAGRGVRGWSATDLRDALERRRTAALVLVDVRPESAFTAGRIPGAVGRPGGQLLQCTDDVVAVETATIVLADDGDGRASIAAYWLRRMGFPDVGTLDGGVPAWRAAGLPVAAGPAAAAVTADAPSVEPVDVADGPGRPLVLDVGTSREFRAGHVPGARWLPRGWLEAKVGEIAVLAEPVVVTAADERQAALAAATLRSLGYGQACWLRGGNAAWRRERGPLATADHLPLDLPPDVVDPPYAKGEAGMRHYLEWEIALTRDGGEQLPAG